MTNVIGRAWFIPMGTSVLSSLTMELDDDAHRLATGRFTNAVYLEPERWPKSFSGPISLDSRDPCFQSPNGVMAESEVPMLIADRLIICTQKFADLVTEFDLGKTHLPPTNLPDEPNLSDNYFCLGLAEKKDSFRPEVSPRAYYVPPFRGQPDKFNIDPMMEGEIVLSSAALSPPDLWAEERILNTGLFVSARLGDALIEQGWENVLEMLPCEIWNEAE